MDYFLKDKKYTFHSESFLKRLLRISSFAQLKKLQHDLDEKFTKFGIIIKSK